MTSWLFGWVWDVLPWLLGGIAVAAWVAGWLRDRALYTWLTVAALGGCLFASGYSVALASCEADALRVELRTLRLRVAAAEQLANEHAERLRVDAEADRLNWERANDTPPNAAACLDRDAARRVRDIR